MFKFSYIIAGKDIKINVAIKDRNIFLERLKELASLAYLGKIHDVNFY